MHSGTAARAYWSMLIVASVILMITMGARQTIGLFVSPLNTSTGLGIATISFAVAVGQFVWGLSQPIFGAMADRFGTARVIVAGGVMLAAGTALTVFSTSSWMLMFSLGLLSAAGAGAGSFSILIGATAQKIPPEKRSFAAGFINAGGSFGQFVFAPLLQKIISTAGWMNALFTMAAITLLTLPLAWPFRRGAQAKRASHATSHQDEKSGSGLKAQLREAFANPSYLCLHASFFTCGFHIAFLITHLPGEVQLCGLSAQVSANAIAIIGLANIAGSLGAGALGQHFRMKDLLFWMYLARTAAILAYLAAPKTPSTMYLFAAVLGITWLATVPPTAGLVGKLFGVRYLATLFGLTLLSHQIGGFFGAWLGGLALTRFGDYGWMWYADAALAAFAAFMNLPIKEAPVRRVATA